MIKECQCGIKFNDETISRCPVCFKHFEQREKGQGIIFVLTRELRKCVSLSRKGKHHKQKWGMHLIYDKRFKIKLKT